MWLVVALVSTMSLGHLCSFRVLIRAATARYAGVLGVSCDPLVSSDIVADPRASIVDLELTKVIDGDLVKVMSWYDNEWGYANQLLREALSVASAGKHRSSQ